MINEFYGPDDYKRSDSLGWLLGRVKNSIAAAADQRLCKNGLTHAQWLPLLLLRLGGEMPIAKLAGELATDAGALTRLLDRLEAKNLCRRERSLEDRRVVIVSLTEEGMAITANLTAVLADTFNAHLKGFTEAEWRSLLDMLRRLIANGEALRQNPCPESSGVADSAATPDSSQESHS